MKNLKSDETKKMDVMKNRIVLHNVAHELTAEQLEQVTGGREATPNPTGTMEGGNGGTFADDQ